jgi:copper chaperone CopZ
MQSKTFQLPMINRDEDVREIETRVGGIAGVRTVEGDRVTKIFAVTWDAPATWEDIERAVVTLGYTLKQK